MIDLEDIAHRDRRNVDLVADLVREGRLEHASIDRLLRLGDLARGDVDEIDAGFLERARDLDRLVRRHALVADRSEEHTSELQSLMRISYDVFCLTNKPKHLNHEHLPL